MTFSKTLNTCKCLHPFALKGSLWSVNKHIVSFCFLTSKSIYSTISIAVIEVFYLFVFYCLFSFFQLFG